MLTLDRVVAGAKVRGLAGPAVVEVVRVEWIGSDALNVVYRSNDGPAEVLLYREAEPRLELVQASRAFSFDGDGEAFRVASEAQRIRLAHLFDPYLAVHSSRIEPLPHQITAVYGEMLPRQPLRFLLADDPGAGKTIMAGLFIKELIIRGDLERCLIVAPGSLVEQWQDELKEKFDLTFDIVSREQIETSVTGNPFVERNHLIMRLDMGARSAYLYNAGENYWFSPIASLNQEAEDRAKGLSGTEVEAEIVTLIRAEERHRGTGFLRVHGAPDDPLGIEDAYEAALVLLPPSAWQRGRDQDTPAMKLAADILEHKGPGQRRNRNRLAFLAADQAALEDIQNVVRKKLAWVSIVRDARGILQLPPAQEDDAKKKLAEQETAALNAVRRGWKHLLLPQEPQPASPNAARGFDLEPVALTNRGSDPMPLAQLAWKKCEEDGLIVARLGVLDNDLGKVWQPSQPHVSVRQLRDWFAQFPYLSKLREPQVLAKAISEALARSDAKYAIADRFDEAKGEYVGLRLAQLVTIDFNSDAVLVRREVADAQLAKEAPQTPQLGAGNTGQIITGEPSVTGPQPSGTPRAARPRRFYAKVTLDPNRPTPQVSNIAQSILSELDRARGTTITLVLDIAAETVDGFSEDVETIVRDNAASLRITDFGFEEE